jgi:hypothetical protein
MHQFNESITSIIQNAGIGGNLDEIFPEDINQGPFSSPLPIELGIRIFSFLRCAELSRCCQVNALWHTSANDDHLWTQAIKREMAFSEDEWERYYGQPDLFPAYR